MRNVQQFTQGDRVRVKNLDYLKPWISGAFGTVREWCCDNLYDVKLDDSPAVVLESNEFARMEEAANV